MEKLDKNSSHSRWFAEAWKFLALADQAQIMRDRRSAERFIDLAMSAFDAAEKAKSEEPNWTVITSRLRR